MGMQLPSSLPPQPANPTRISASAHFIREHCTVDARRHTMRPNFRLLADSLEDPRMIRACVALLMLLVAGPVLADVESPLVKQGLAAYAELDYARAVKLLDQARKESLTREEKIATYQTLAMAQV